ncbi:MAG TPA: double zinc ribbon domain-containing protein [Candidatus Sulfotelmatobacter sp.]|nr:double zinc ribbon domain-containing protein [Candidatus Sulfotelmatobacter sp.]
MATESAARPRAGDVLAALLGLVFPAPCHTCGQPLGRQRRSALCGRCWERMERVLPGGCSRCGWSFPDPAAALGAERPLCQRCRNSADDFRVARAVLLYRESGIVRDAILLSKHAGRRPLLRHLAALLAAEAPLHLSLTEWDGLVPVPLHWLRQWRRGFNQAEILARAVGREHDLPVVAALARVRRTPPQHGDATTRRRNVRGAFAVRAAARVAGRRLLLVDDVFTTGATANAAASALLASGADDVGVLTLARVA